MKTDLGDIIGGCSVILFGVLISFGITSAIVYVIVKTILFALK